MNRPAPALPRAQILAERALARIESFLHIEALSGAVLLVAAAIALAWANSPAAASYHALWHAPLSLGIGSHVFSQPLHFWINDGLMTVFFLVVGMEIRREIHEGALATLRLAALPLAAALGGVLAPALIYLAVNGATPGLRHGWAVPTATDIAFAVGVLALLGRAVPPNLRIFLLALAVIDDIVAVLIIALFYSGGLAWEGLLVAGLGIAMVLGLQRAGAAAAWAYILPGAVLWLGLLLTGAHPSLAGVALGLMTPVWAARTREPALLTATQAIADLHGQPAGTAPKASLRALRRTPIAMVPPVIRVQQALHPWVAYGVMPLFALANAGVSVQGADLSSGGAQGVLLGVALALWVGKPLGVLAVSWLVVTLGWCRLPEGVDWRGVTLVGLLAGIGFTMAIFIAMLAFDNAALLAAAKLGVLLGSLGAALFGLGYGALVLHRGRAQAVKDQP